MCEKKKKYTYFHGIEQTVFFYFQDILEFGAWTELISTPSEPKSLALKNFLEIINIVIGTVRAVYFLQSDNESEKIRHLPSMWTILRM